MALGPASSEDMKPIAAFALALSLVLVGRVAQADPDPDPEPAAAVAAPAPAVDAEAARDPADVPDEPLAPALAQEVAAATAGIDATIDTAATDRALAARPADAELAPSIDPERFRSIVRVVKRAVLARMEAKLAASAAAKLSRFATGIALVSLLGLGLLFMPLVLRRRYPGRGKVLFQYSALAAGTFVVLVNLFGGVLVGMKTVQGALGTYTNPSLAVAAGTFDTLDKNAEDYIVMGKELFVPTLEQLQSSDEQPAVLLLENGKKIVASAQVFVTVGKTLKRLDFLFQLLPVVLFGVTMLLFGLAIRPTLTEIIKLPMRAAAGEQGVGREVTRRVLQRVWGELRATLCTIGVLAVLTLMSGALLGEIVGPALAALLGYFSFAVNYLQFVPDASSALVFAALFGVILFLGCNLVTLIASVSLFLGKCQKIFQLRFTAGVPIRTHARFFRGGIPALLLVQVFPWGFAVVAEKILEHLNTSLLAGVTDAQNIAWTKLMLAGPLFLVVGYALAFWAARGVKALRFLQAYKVTA